ncbi:phospholipase D [Trifolium repens]|nr:phospholipase D [Trifolium repens]
MDPRLSMLLLISPSLSRSLFLYARVVCEETWRKKPKSKEPIAKRAEVGKGKKVKDPNVLKRPPTVFVVFMLQIYSTFTLEPSKLANGRPNVKNVTLLQKDWWGSGIVRNKVWISNYRDVYIGSANNDWKLLTHILSRCYQCIKICKLKSVHCHHKTGYSQFGIRHLLDLPY